MIDRPQGQDSGAPASGFGLRLRQVMIIVGKLKGGKNKMEGFTWIAHTWHQPQAILIKYSKYLPAVPDLMVVGVTSGVVRNEHAFVLNEFFPL